jgi:hypothetical protein
MRPFKCLIKSDNRTSSFQYWITVVPQPLCYPSGSVAEASESSGRGVIPGRGGGVAEFFPKDTTPSNHAREKAQIRGAAGRARGWQDGNACTSSMLRWILTGAYTGEESQKHRDTCAPGPVSGAARQKSIELGSIERGRSKAVSSRRAPPQYRAALGAA